MLLSTVAFALLFVIFTFVTPFYVFLRKNHENSCSVSSLPHFRILSMHFMGKLRDKLVFSVSKWHEYAFVVLFPWPVFLVRYLKS